MSIYEVKITAVGTTTVANKEAPDSITALTTGLLRRYRDNKPERLTATCRPMYEACPPSSDQPKEKEKHEERRDADCRTAGGTRRVPETLFRPGDPYRSSRPAEGRDSGT